MKMKQAYREWAEKKYPNLIGLMGSDIETFAIEFAKDMLNDPKKIGTLCHCGENVIMCTICKKGLKEETINK